MPWTWQEFKEKHNKGLGKEKARLAAKIANEILAKTGDEAKAIRVANARVKDKRFGRTSSGYKL